MKKVKIIIFVLAGMIFPLFVADAINLANVSGRIVLQVEENGEAWYVSPRRLERTFLGRPTDAFSLMREKGIGISNIDLNKIPLGLDAMTGPDSDKDGLTDELEKAIGTNYLNKDSDGDSFNDLEEYSREYNPSNRGILSIDPYFAAKNAGKIFLQVESRGEAWYVYPPNGKRYFLGRPSDAFNLMRGLGLGISNRDLAELLALTPSYNISSFEKKIHDLVNGERVKNNLKPLLFNAELAEVARGHSQSLANENKSFTSIDAVCSYPIIHHEGLDFGLYHGARLNSRGIKYFKMSGENIALLSAASISLTYEQGSIDANIFDECSAQQALWDKEFKERIENEKDDSKKVTILKNELQKRKNAYNKSPQLTISSTEWESEEVLARRAVDGWMNSPGHRKNILTAEYDEAGMGVVYVNSYVIITQVFIARTNCGYEGAACCQGDGYQSCYLPNKCEASICK